MNDLLGRPVGTVRGASVQDNGSDVRQVGANGLYVPAATVKRPTLTVYIRQLENSAYVHAPGSAGRARQLAEVARLRATLNREGK